MERYSRVNIRDKNQVKQVRISSLLKPEIEESIINKWQSLIDTAARIVGVPSGLIMKLNEDTIEVFLKSNTEGNPYERGEKADLVYGLYCETVIGSQQKLLVADARKSSVWSQNNPDIGLNMVSYLGFPLNWPDGEVFGTVCFLDNKENKYNKDFEDLLNQLKQHIENDLNVTILNIDLKDRNLELQRANNTKSKFLSLISHDIRGSIGTISEFIKLIIEDLDSYDNYRLKQILSSLGQSASTSYETLENLLSWSKNDILQLDPEMKIVDVINVIEKVLFYFKQHLRLKSIEVIKNYESLQAFTSVDENMITVVIRNLISNAIKYNSKQGKIRIQVFLENDKQVIIIEDSGTGMSQNVINNLFSYNEEHKVGTDGESSAGIGLILTKEFLNKMNATIKVDSERDKGSRFRIELIGHKIN